MKINIEAEPAEVAALVTLLAYDVEFDDEDETPEGVTNEPPKSPMDSVAKMFGRKDEEPKAGLWDNNDLREIFEMVKAKLDKKG